MWMDANRRWITDVKSQASSIFGLARKIGEGVAVGDGYLGELKALAMKYPDDDTFCVDQLTHVMLDLIQAATDAPATFLTWFVYFMAKNPEIQSELAKEVAVEFGESALDVLPLLDSIYLETHRLGSVQPLVTRSAAEKFVYCNYVIPKGTTVLLRLQSAHIIHGSSKILGRNAV